MKSILLICAFALCSIPAFCTKVTITNAGFTFSPNVVTINFGDTIVFQLASIHDVLEVSQSTWNANGNSPGTGFSTPFGGGMVTNLSVGNHFYVCEPHAASGMKGRITVNAASGTTAPTLNSDQISVFPNPTVGKFTVQYQPAGTSGSDNNITAVEIFDMAGSKVLTMPALKPQPSVEIDLSDYPTGVYYVRIYDRQQTWFEKIVKQ